MRLFPLFFALALPLISSGATNMLLRQLDDIIGTSDVGLALVMPDGETIVRGGDEYFDMSGVDKFHQAVALARSMDFDSIVNAVVTVDDTDLRSGTWSPLRAQINDFPCEVPLVQLLDYSLNLSDNNAADIIAGRFIAPSQVEKVLKECGLSEKLSICKTEVDIAFDTAVAGNLTTPLEAARLIYRFFASDTCASSTLVKAIMARDNPFGINRIPAGVAEGEAKVFHKTGTGVDNPDGTLSAINDVAFVSYRRPGGYGCYALAVFLRNFNGSKTDGEQLIADISRAVWSNVIVKESIAMNEASVVCATQGGVRNVSADNGHSLFGVLFEAATYVISDIIDRKIYGD